jgi:hypothetical protein
MAVNLSKSEAKDSEEVLSIYCRLSVFYRVQPPGRRWKAWFFIPGASTVTNPFLHGKALQTAM